MMKYENRTERKKRLREAAEKKTAKEEITVNIIMRYVYSCFLG